MTFENQVVLPAGSNWYKGNLHSHTVNSDGCLTPKQSVELYRDHGYQFLCFSEHDRYTDYRNEFDSQDFIILPGLEASAVLYADEESGDRLKVHHMHGILGTEEMQKNARAHFSGGEFLPPPLYYGSWDGAAAAQQLSDTLRAYGCFVTYNHPIWSRVRLDEFWHTEGVTALEIYNYGTVNESGTGYDTTFWDQILREGRQIFAFASDDNHNEGKFSDSCGGWIVVSADHLTHDEIVTAIMNGRYYSSCGPKIREFGLIDDTVYVKCSPCSRVNFICGGYINAGTTIIARKNSALEEAQFRLKGTEQYVRVECVNEYGKTAWTNAIFPKKQRGIGCSRRGLFSTKTTH